MKEFVEVYSKCYSDELFQDRTGNRSSQDIFLSPQHNARESGEHVIGTLKSETLCAN